MNIKVCGITSLKQLQQLDGLNVDYAGLVFDENSPRYAGNSFEADEIEDADLDITAVGIFKDMEYEDIMEMVEKYDLNIVQLNGDETPELCEELNEDVDVIKKIKIGPDTESVDALIADYDNVCDYYIFDNETGETDKKFDWKKLEKAKIEKPFFLSGGIGPEDAAAVKKFRHPDFLGVNINTRFEKQPGVKDMALVLKFLHDLK